MTRVLALDIGAVRIGVSLSDATRLLASPYMTLRVAPNEEETLAAIQRLIEETEVGELVIGLPISLDGQIHAQGQRVQAFAARLKPHITVPLTFWDERLSTVEAERLLAQQEGEGGRRRSRRGGRQHGQGRRKKQRSSEGIDALAATVILQEYLDALRSGKKDEDQ
jgi:putative Holliday junction resolvase